ncbi:hypothetical protein [Marivirga tractuosa]|nr:hypothetical protein [Marivirga tractuosa]
MFKEILKFQKPKYLVYEAFLPSFKNSYDFNNLFSNAEFMANEMIYNEFLTEKFLDLLFPVIKYKAYLKQEAINILRGNQKKSYYESSWIKGHRPSNRVNDSIDIKKFPPIYSFSNTDLLPIATIEKYLSKIKSICEENNIKLICMRAPYPPSRMLKSTQDTAHMYFKNYFNKNQIPFYDLNYQSKTFYTDFDFEDYHHMNSIGAKKASKDLAIILNSYEGE